MDSFVDHYFSINQTDYDMNMPLQSAKYIIDILSPLILFSLADDDNLLIHDKNHTQLSRLGPTLGNGGPPQLSGYEYFMQFNIYPQYKQFLKQKENFCKRVVESFYPPHKNEHNDLEYETIKPFLEEYYHIKEDPRKLISMRQDGNSVTYTKERWIEFVLRMSPYCSLTEQPEGTYPSIMGWINTDYYKQLTQWIESLSVRLPTDNIWKYLMAKKYY